MTTPPTAQGERAMDDYDEWEECDVCGGWGVDGHDCGEDACPCAELDDNMPCSQCDGAGGWGLA